MQWLDIYYHMSQKGQKGMSIMMERACEDAKHGNMDLKESVHHMGNVLLNGLETSQEEAAFLLLQLPMIYMSRGTTFINTSAPHERTFLVKKNESSEKMDPHSTEIQRNNLINHYRNRPKMFLNYTLADFATKLNIVYPKGFTDDESTDDMDKDSPCNDDDEGNDQPVILMHCSNGVIFKKCQKDGIIWYVNIQSRKILKIITEKDSCYFIHGKLSQ